ncbi:tctex1 domain-containing protein 1-like [Anneissia japonica]|uniref:tctex1 domain-containing protein 1-like n=1 Tax=Anneissia japonica TaxID=1529436 RepID=UPI00142572F9|nr:tctex1 domain-containing protein 1-like [Anneissia japonica]
MTQVAGSKYSASTQRTERSQAIRGPQIKYEHTYKMEPDRVFVSHQAKCILDGILKQRLESETYDPEKCNNLCRELSDKIKNRVKDLGYPRYKLVVVVSIGSVAGATLCTASQCIWNDKFDTFAEHSYKNGSIYAVATVYGVYQE